VNPPTPGASPPPAPMDPIFFASERALEPGPAGELHHDEAHRRIRVEQVVPRGISSGVRPPRLTPPAKKQRPAAAPHPRPTGPPPAAHPDDASFRRPPAPSTRRTEPAAQRHALSRRSASLRPSRFKIHRATVP
jgi:hypothetical protein